MKSGQNQLDVGLRIEDLFRKVFVNSTAFRLHLTENSDDLDNILLRLNSSKRSLAATLCEKP